MTERCMSCEMWLPETDEWFRFHPNYPWVVQRKHAKGCACEYHLKRKTRFTQEYAFFAVANALLFLYGYGHWIARWW